MFQYNPDNWDLENYLSEHGVIEDWRANQHWKEMDVGQRVYLMRSGGRTAALTAVGRLLGESYPCPKGECKAHVDVLIEARILQPLTRDEMRDDTVLKSYGPYCDGQYRTNFILPDDVAQRTEELVLPRLQAISSDADLGELRTDTTIDARTRVNAAVVRRQGQPEFRRKLLEVYEYRCAITRCDAVDALEAAHIRPYLGPHCNHVTNGLLLRADIHTLFDLELQAIDTTSMTVRLAPSLKTTTYGELDGRLLRMPTTPTARPSVEALDEHRRDAGL
jgi:hypothetical protein